jgi:hypothetical protein
MPIQIIDSRNLSGEENRWLKGLTKDLEIGAAIDILEEGRKKAGEIPMGAYLQIEQGREKIARNALAKGLPLDTIGEITGLDIETIKSFANR